MKIEFVMNGHPPSTNNLFLTIGRRRIKTKEYRAFETKVQAILFKRGDRPEVSKMTGKPYALTIELLSAKWICKNGNYLRKDVGNFEKAINDIVAEFYGLRDEHCMVLTVKKISAPYEMTRAIFEFYEPHDFQFEADLRL